MLKVAEIWFDSKAEKPNDCDIIYYMQIESPLKESKNSEFETLVIDLAQTEEEIFSRFKKDTRSETRRAMNENVVTEIFNSPAKEELISFCNFYDDFAKIKKLPPIERNRIAAMAENNSLLISRAMDGDKSIVFHAYYLNLKRARLLHSCSLFKINNDSSYRSFIGRANKLLHWKDMLFLKNQGTAIYDLGGWYPGAEDQAKISINKFKEEFGGEPRKDFSSTVVCSTKGRLSKMIDRIIS